MRKARSAIGLARKIDDALVGIDVECDACGCEDFKCECRPSERDWIVIASASDTHDMLNLLVEARDMLEKLSRRRRKNK